MPMKSEHHWIASRTVPETTNAYFEFVLHEIQNAKCGGDSETSPAIDRYRVYRRSGKIEQWEATEDKWHAYKGAQTK